jgi:hypothetical protein
MTVTKLGLTAYRIQILLLLEIKESDKRKFCITVVGLEALLIPTERTVWIVLSSVTKLDST